MKIVNGEAVLTIDLTPQEWNIAIGLLLVAGAPFAHAAPVIGRIQQQLNNQQSPPPRPPSQPPVGTDAQMRALEAQRPNGQAPDLSRINEDH